MSTKPGFFWRQPVPQPPQTQDPAVASYLKSLAQWAGGFQDNYNRLASADLSAQDVNQLVTTVQSGGGAGLPSATYYVFNAFLDANNTWRKTDKSSSSWAFQFARSTDQLSILYSPPNQNPITWSTYLTYPGNNTPTGSTDIASLGYAGAHYAGLTLTYITAAAEATLTGSRRLVGTANQVILTDGGAGSTMTLGLPQNIHTGASPTFADLTLSALTNSRLLATNGADLLVSVANLASWILGTINQVTVTNNGDGTVTLALPQNINTGASPTFVGLNLSGLTATRLLSSDGSKNLASVANLVSWVKAGTGVTVTDNGDGTCTVATAGGGSLTFVWGETAGGLINGTNKRFTLAHTPATFGLVFMPGVTWNWVWTGGNAYFDFNDAPPNGVASPRVCYVY